MKNIISKLKLIFKPKNNVATLVHDNPAINAFGVVGLILAIQPGRYKKINVATLVHENPVASTLGLTMKPRVNKKINVAKLVHENPAASAFGLAIKARGYRKITEHKTEFSISTVAGIYAGQTGNYDNLWINARNEDKIEIIIEIFNEAEQKGFCYVDYMIGYNKGKSNLNLGTLLKHK